MNDDEKLYFHFKQIKFYKKCIDSKLINHYYKLPSPVRSIGFRWRCMEMEGCFMNRFFMTLAGVLMATSALAAEPISQEKAEQNKAVARSFYSLINGGDVEKWKAAFAPNWKAHPPLPSAPDQIAGYQQVIGAFRAGVPNLVVKQVEVIANDDVVAVRSRVTGKNTQKLFGQPATQRQMEFTAMDIHRIVDGKIVETWHVEDFLRMNQQLSGKNAKSTKR